MVRGLAALAASALLAGPLTATSAVASTDAGFFLNDSWTTAANHVFMYGRLTDEVLVGDWDGDGRDTLAVRRDAVYHVTDDLTGGPAQHVVAYGRPGDQVVVGDWDGDGQDTFAVRRGATYYLKDSIGAGDADHVVVYGRAGDVTLAGDWDGDGDDTLAVRRGSTYHVKNAIAPGTADLTLVYGRAGDEVYVGDWDGDGQDTLGVRRGREFAASVEPVTAQDIGTTWRAGCPVAPADLRTVVASHWTDAGVVGTGRLVVAASLAEDMVGILRDLYDARYPIHRMAPAAEYGGDDGDSVSANNTSAFNGRAVTLGTSLSEHAYGRAIDVNPLVNPYIIGSTVLPPASAPYVERGQDALGMIHAGDEVVRAFATRGWSWGGAWANPRDYQHFSTTNR